MATIGRTLRTVTYGVALVCAGATARCVVEGDWLGALFGVLAVVVLCRWGRTYTAAIERLDGES